MRKCPNCGEHLQEHDRVCRNCGAFLDVEPLEEEFFSEKEQKAENSSQDFLDIPSYEEVSARPKKQKQKRKFYWKPPILFTILGLIAYLASIIVETTSNQAVIRKAFYMTSIINAALAGISFLIVIILYIAKKEFHYTMTPREIIDSNASPTEQRRMAFVGKNYVKISKKNFSIPAFLLNIYYLLYRKKYLPAFLIMLTILIVIKLANNIEILKYIIGPILIVISLLLGLFFNKRYIKYINKKTKTLKEKNSNLDVETFLKLCQKKGGTSIFTATLIYALFITTIITITTIEPKKINAPKKEEQQQQEQLDVKVKVIDRNYQRKKKQCQNYAQAVCTSYTNAGLEIAYIGCNMGKEKYVLLKAINQENPTGYIAKYQIKTKQEELKLENTTLELESLRQKQQMQNLTPEEVTKLTELETLEREFNSFDTKVAEEKASYKEDKTYKRNYIKIETKTLT